MFRKIVLQSVWVLFSVLNAQDPQPQQMLAKHDKHYFIENKGQWNSDVLYLARMGGLDAWITKYGVNYTFYKLEEMASPNKKEEDLHLPDKFRHKDYNMIGHRVHFKLQNHNPNPAREGLHQQSGYYNYFIGNDPSKHATNVGLFKEAVVKNVYQGIDLRYYFDRGSLRYDYVVHAGADPSQIVFRLEGADKTYLNDKGQLVFDTRFGEVAMADLEVYQGGDKKRVGAQFVCMAGGRWGFSLGKYDKTQDLVIDPLIYSTYLGGSDGEGGEDIAVDNFGNAYVVGSTTSYDYDTTAGAFQTVYLDSSNISGFHANAFITKLNSNGTALIYSTFIGGSINDYGNSIAIDSSGNAYITGTTWSLNYPVTAGSFQTNYGGGYTEVFVTKMNSSGTNLLYSTYLGGSDVEESNAIAIDLNRNAYIVGYTNSLDFDVTNGSYQTTYNNRYDGFVTKLNSMGTGLEYSTYIGGSDYDEIYAVLVDENGYAYIGGLTFSNNFDVTNGAYQTTNDGWAEGFVSKINASGNALEYSTYIGGDYYDEVNSIALDSFGCLYLTGYTMSNNFDVTQGSYQTILEGDGDAFVTKINPSGNALIYSTLIGGSSEDSSASIAIDIRGNAYITGRTNSTDYEITFDALQPTFVGLWYDIFITKLDTAGKNVLYSTYLGGQDLDISSKITVNNHGLVYLTGCTFSLDYVVTNGAHQTMYGGSGDVFVSKFKLQDQVFGGIYSDYNQNCIQDSLENRVHSPISVSIQPGNHLVQVINGFWYIDSLPPGTYTATVDTSGPWKASCSPSVSFTVVHPDSFVIAPSIGMYNANPCPDPQISIFMPFIRFCFSEQRIKVEACNSAMGTEILHNAYAEVHLDSFLQVDSASLAYIYQGNGVYRFLLDSLYPGQCDVWYIYTTVSCSAAFG